MAFAPMPSLSALSAPQCAAPVSTHPQFAAAPAFAAPGQVLTQVLSQSLPHGLPHGLPQGLLSSLSAALAAEQQYQQQGPPPSAPPPRPLPADLHGIFGRLQSSLNPALQQPQPPFSVRAARSN